MATMVRSFAIQGIEGYPVEIEATLLEGMPMLSIIGLGDQAVREAGERIQAAINSAGYQFPKKKVILSLAPGDIRKRGSHFDLGMALAILQESEEVGAKNLGEYGVIGELALNGSIRPCTGILPMIMAASKNGIRKVIVPAGNYKEAKLIKNIEVFAFGGLSEAVRFLEGKGVSSQTVGEEELPGEQNSVLDFADVKGQDELIDAAVLAAAGGHNMLMIGEPGCGKTMIAQRIPTILPEMTESESLEITKIYSIAGLLKNGHTLVNARPFRAPHHNASLNALIGGGVNALPGEVSLAHNGVLFLDELTEFSRRTLDALRQPIEDKKVCISRVNGTNTFPANFMFVTAMNPCPCGYYPGKKCRCTDYEIIKYRSRISGPIMDRIDVQKEVHPVGYFELESMASSRDSKTLRNMVEAARKIQQERFADEEGVNSNAQMTTSMIQKYCGMDKETLSLLKENCEKYSYSARVIHKLMRMARTSADLDGAEKIRRTDVERVLGCRDLDKSSSRMMVVT
ncbi:MAG: YifB family Mg chelatase-like AAA ATPase [Lachnospiraceae bacterium]|nr:YifB family Mg chelatase-like AAA ATPase [Lachnospiraceae bacterium]